MPQNWRPMPGYSVLESVEYAAWLKRVPDHRLRQLAMDALSEVGLADKARIKVTRLSGGEQQRVGLAESFAHEPSLLLLDEPTAGLDPLQRRHFHSILRGRGRTAAIVLSTHLTEDVSAVADRVLVMKSGHIVFDGGVSEAERLGARGQASGESAIEAAYRALVDIPAVLGCEGF